VDLYRLVCEEDNNENSNLNQWLNWFKNKQIASLPVSWSGIETNKGGISYGGNVTFDKIMKDAKAGYNANPQNVLNQLSSTLQDYVIGLQEDKKVINRNTASQLVAMFQDLNNVKYFIDNYQPSQKPIASIPQERPEDFRAVGDDEEKELEDYTNAYFDSNSALYKMLRDDKFLHDLQKSDPKFYNELIIKIQNKIAQKHGNPIKNTEKELIGNTIQGKSSEEASLLMKKELTDYLNRAETEEEKQKIMRFLNQTAPYELDPTNNQPKDPELQKLLMRSNFSKDSTRHLMTPQQKQEFDRRYKLSQEYRRLTNHSPDRDISTDEIEKMVNDMNGI